MKIGDLIEICPCGADCQSVVGEDSIRHVFGVVTQLTWGGEAYRFVDRLLRDRAVAAVGVIVAESWAGWIPDGLESAWLEHNADDSDPFDDYLDCQIPGEKA